jgi:hypothetical protein
MSIADVVREKAISLARAEVSEAEAVRELLECCSEKRVPVVLARQQFMKDLEDPRADPVVRGAADLLDRVLELLPAS